MYPQEINAVEKRESVVDGQLSSLENAVMNLSGEVDNLERILSSVLTDGGMGLVVLGTSLSATKEPQILSTVPNRIRNQRDTVDQIANKVRSILSRIQL